jgi:CRP-like cAMP-binding protein
MSVSTANPELAVLTNQLGERDLQAVLRLAKIVDVGAGQAICQDRQPVDALHHILDGVFEVTLADGGESMRLGRLGRGQWIGEVALFSEAPLASATVTAEGSGRLLRLAYRDFDALRTQSPEAAARLVRVLSDEMVERLRASGEQLVRAPDGRFALKGSEAVHTATAQRRHGIVRLLRLLAGIKEGD